MMKRFAFTVFAAAALAVGLSPAARAQDAETIASPAPAQVISGRWEIERGVNQGVDVPEAELKGSFAIITPKMITTFDAKEKETYKASYTINDMTSPMQIDMTSIRGGQQVRSLGIIRFDDRDGQKQRTLTLAYSLDPNQRPMTFESAEGSKVMLFEMTSDMPIQKSSP